MAAPARFSGLLYDSGGGAHVAAASYNTCNISSDGFAFQSDGGNITAYCLTNATEKFAVTFTATTGYSGSSFAANMGIVPLSLVGNNLGSAYQNPGAACVQAGGQVFYNTGSLVAGPTLPGVWTTAMLLVDPVNQCFWVTNAGTDGSFYGLAGTGLTEAQVLAGVGGFPLGSTGPYAIFAQVYSGDAVVHMNAGQEPPPWPLPAGFGNPPGTFEAVIQPVAPASPVPFAWVNPQGETSIYWSADNGSTWTLATGVTTGTSGTAYGGTSGVAGSIETLVFKSGANPANMTGPRYGAAMTLPTDGSVLVGVLANQTWNGFPAALPLVLSGGAYSRVEVLVATTGNAEGRASVQDADGVEQFGFVLDPFYGARNNIKYTPPTGSVLSGSDSAASSGDAQWAVCTGFLDAHSLSAGTAGFTDLIGGTVGAYSSISWPAGAAGNRFAQVVFTNPTVGSDGGQFGASSVVYVFAKPSDGPQLPSSAPAYFVFIF